MAESRHDPDADSLIPPHIFWPGFVIFLLSISIVSGVITIVASQSNGGPQVVKSYSSETRADRADRRDQLQQNQRLGWSIDVEPAGPVAEGVLAPVTLEVRDASGEPLSELRGRVELKRPSIAGIVAESDVTSVVDEPGMYRVKFPLQQPGLWDFEIRLEHGDDVYTKTVRKEIGL